MKIKDVMETNFVSFQADDKLDYVLRKFAKHNITSAPVFDSGEFIGVTNINILLRVLSPKKYLISFKKNAPTPIRTTTTRMIMIFLIFILVLFCISAYIES